MKDTLSVTRAGVPLSVGILPIATMSSICEVELPLGVRVPPETHQYDERVIIVDGEGIFEFGDQHPYQPGDMFFVPAGTEHSFAEVASRTVFLRLVTSSRKVAA